MKGTANPENRGVTARSSWPQAGKMPRGGVSCPQPASGNLGSLSTSLEVQGSPGFTCKQVLALSWPRCNSWITIPATGLQVPFSVGSTFLALPGEDRRLLRLVCATEHKLCGCGFQDSPGFCRVCVKGETMASRLRTDFVDVVLKLRLGSAVMAARSTTALHESLR